MASYIPDENYGFYTGSLYDPSSDYESYKRRATDGETDDPRDGTKGDDPKHKNKDKNKGKDKDKDKGKGNTDSKPEINITRNLIRNEDGTIGVQFIDMDTGRVVKNPYGDRKDIWTAQTDLRDILKEAGLKGGKGDGKGNNQNTGAQSYQEIDGYIFVGYDDKGNPKYVPINGGPVSASARAPSESTVSGFTTPIGPSAANQTFTPDEQGDTFEDTAFDPMSGLRDPAKDPDYQIDGKFAPDKIAERDFQSEVAANTKTNAYDKNLSEVDHQYGDGNNFSTADGTPHSDLNSSLSNRNWDQATIDKAARTLAGELGPNVDLSTPEGQMEARAILSTIENRDIANGPQETVVDAITAPSQYSTWNDERAAKVANTNFSLKSDEFTKTVQDYLNDPNSNLGFTSYHAPYVNPAWSDEMQDVQEIGGHKFGTLPEYTSKMAKYEAPLSEEQSDALATSQINQNFKQGFAYPAGYDLVNNQPQIDLTGVNDMATGIQAQRDYVAPANSLDGFSKGIQAQRDYVPVQQIKEEAPIGVFEGAQVDPTATINNQISMDNGFAIQQGNQIAGIAPTVDAPTEMATRGLPPAIDIGGQIYTPDEGLSNNSIPTSTVESRMGLPDPSSLDSRMSGELSKSPAGVYGDPTNGFGVTDNQAMGFGDYVTTDPNVAQVSAESAQTQTGRINGMYENDNVGMIDQGLAMATNAPTISAADAVQSQNATSDATSAGAGANTTGVSSGISTDAAGSRPDPSVSSTSGTTGTTTGISGTSGGIATGFASAEVDVEGDDGY